jgi:hypothetical protein
MTMPVGMRNTRTHRRNPILIRTLCQVEPLGDFTVTKCMALLISMCALNSVAESQTNVEVARITCDQFILFKVKDPQKIAIWLSGYYNGIRRNTLVDVGLLEERAEELKDYCYTNPKIYVMDAAEKVFRTPNTK